MVEQDCSTDILIWLSWGLLQVCEGGGDVIRECGEAPGVHERELVDSSISPSTDNVQSCFSGCAMD